MLLAVDARCSCIEDYPIEIIPQRVEYILVSYKSERNPFMISLYDDSGYNKIMNDNYQCRHTRTCFFHCTAPSEIFY